MRTAEVTSSGGQTLLVPSGFAFKMALLGAAIQTAGLAEGRQRFPLIRDLRIALALPEQITVLKSFARIRRPFEVKDAQTKEAKIAELGLYPGSALYIDKPMRDHGLFQAICRVNRLDGDDKEYGYIIDYKDLFQSLARSINDYTSAAFDGYDKEDVALLLSNRLEKARERLETARESIKALCEPVAAPKDPQDYQHYFCAQNTADHDALRENEARRLTLYKLTAALIRAYANLANELPEAGYSAQESEQIKREVEHYEKVRAEIKLASGDYIDLKTYEPAMRHLIDTYIQAQDSKKVSAFDDLTLIQLIVERGVDGLKDLPEGIASSQGAMAETIENNLRRLIIDEMPINPRYYEKMSELLDTLIQERQSQARDYEDYLAKIVALARQAHNPDGGPAYPASLNTRARRALYDNLGKNEQLAIEVDAAIQHTKKDVWRSGISSRSAKCATRLSRSWTMRVWQLKF